MKTTTKVTKEVFHAIRRVSDTKIYTKWYSKTNPHIMVELFYISSVTYTLSSEHMKDRLLFGLECETFW